ncbi:MAG: 3-hydroxyacyl-ACP dehydratase FabZ [Fibrobacterales bacterium]
MSLLESLPKPEADNCIIDFAGITKVLPHRFPFLLVDRVIEMELEKTIVVTKNVSFNEPFFQGHFPEDPVMPGVLQTEAMAQAGCILIALSYEEETKGKRPAFMGVDSARFKRPVRPGDVLTITATMEKWRRGIATWSAVITVDGKVAASATLMATMV